MSTVASRVIKLAVLTVAGEKAFQTFVSQNVSSSSCNRSTIKYKQLNDDQEANVGFDLRRIALHSGHDAFNGSVEPLPVFRRVTNFDDVCSDSSCIISPEGQSEKYPAPSMFVFHFAAATLRA